MAPRLPPEIWLTVLKEYISNLRDYSYFDMAMCSRADRQEFLLWLSNPTIALHDSFGVVGYVLAQNQYVINFLVWLASRQIPLLSLLMRVSKIPALFNARHTLRYSAVTKLSLMEELGNRVEVNNIDLATFLAYFPALTEVDCSQWSHMSDKDLIVIPAVVRDLKVLNLFNCDFLSTDMIALVAGRYGSSLEDLWTSVVSVPSLSTIGTQCPKLLKISLDCTQLTSISLIKFISRYATLQTLHLTFLSVEWVAGVVTDALIGAMAKCCPMLTVLNVLGCEEVTTSSFPFIITGCRDIREITTNFYQYDLRQQQGESTGKGCELVCQYTDVEDISLLLHSCLLPLFKIDTCDAVMDFSIDVMELLWRRFGHCLQEIIISLDMSVAEKDVRQLLQHCPYLTCICLYNCHQLTDDLLVELPRFCPLITQIGFGEAIHITDNGLLGALTSYQGNVMRSISICGCHQLTDMVLFGIADLFPTLERLSIQESSITREAVLQLILENSFHPAAIDVDVSVKMWLSQHLQMLGTFGADWIERLVEPQLESTTGW